MKKFVVGLVFSSLIAGCATAPDAPIVTFNEDELPNLYISKAALKNMEAFERLRPKACIQLDEKLDQFQASQFRVFSADEPNEEWRQVLKGQTEFYFDENDQYVQQCVPSSISFYRPEVEKACTESNFDGQICQDLETFREAQIEELDIYFPETMAEIQDYTQNNPWQVINFKGKMVTKVGVAHLQKGNVFVEYTLEVEAMPLNQLGSTQLAEYIVYQDELGFRLMDATNIYVPFFLVRMITSGVSDEEIKAKVVFNKADEDRSGADVFPVTVSYPGRGYQMFSRPLTRELVSELKSSEAIVSKGVEGRFMDGDLLFLFRRTSKNLPDVVDDLLAHYREVGPLNP